MVFYNGFNLLVDIILITIASVVTYKIAWWDGFKAGVEDTVRNTDVQR